MTLRLPTPSLALLSFSSTLQYSYEVTKVGSLGIVKSRSTVSLILGNFGKVAEDYSYILRQGREPSVPQQMTASLTTDSKVRGRHTVLLLPTHHPLTAHWLG